MLEFQTTFWNFKIRSIKIARTKRNTRIWFERKRSQQLKTWRKWETRNSDKTNTVFAFRKCLKKNINTTKHWLSCCPFICICVFIHCTSLPSRPSLSHLITCPWLHNIIIAFAAGSADVWIQIWVEAETFVQLYCFVCLFCCLLFDCSWIGCVKSISRWIAHPQVDEANLS